MKKIELLAPAGDLEKLKMAIVYGADAVYLGGEAFGLRRSSKNFSLEDIKKGVSFAHDRGKKVYVTLNIIPHPKDLEGLEEYVRDLYDIGIDAVIVSDPGMFSIIHKTVPDLEIHMSTQASITNAQTINFWYTLGAKRVILARELSLDEIQNIREDISHDMTIETFVHGAMCISYSGRCLLSNYMTGRDANMGDCAHPCRYKYHLVEEKRPSQYFPVFEEEDGSFIMNSKDLCMIEYIPDLIKAGINSFKIEGRAKSSYYVATVIRSYRMAIDEYYRDKDSYKFNKDYLNEIKKASHRDFTTGFFFGKPTDEAQVYESSSYIRGYDFVGMVLDYDKATGIATIEQRNRIFQGDEIEVFGPGIEHFIQRVDSMWDDSGAEIDVAPHPQQIIKIKMDHPVEKYYLMRKFKGVIR